MALVDTSSMRANGNGTTRLLGPTLAEYEGLCPRPRFAAQPTRAFCSGSLVAPDVVLTAGHCVTDVTDLASTRFGFGFRVVGGKARVDIPNGEIYRGTAILACCSC